MASDPSSIVDVGKRTSKLSHEIIFGIVYFTNLSSPSGIPLFTHWPS